MKTTLTPTEQHYANLVVRDDRRHGKIVELTVDRPTNVVGPYSRKVRNMHPGDVMHVDLAALGKLITENFGTDFKTLIADDARLLQQFSAKGSVIAVRCRYCGTKPNHDTHCENCGGPL